MLLKNSWQELCSFSFLKTLNFLRCACRLFLHDQLQEVKKYFKHLGSHSLSTRDDQNQSVDKKCDGGRFPLKSPFISTLKSDKFLGNLVSLFLI